MRSTALLAARAILKLCRGVIRTRSGHRLVLDERDNRALRLVLARGELDRSVVSLWHQLVDDLRPAVVLDIGANYGEVSFSREYDPQTLLHLVEPNPTILPYLRRTARMFPHRFITLHEVAASDGEGAGRLGVAASSSGLAQLTDSGEYEVPLVRLDQAIGSVHSLVFKVDVEGHERAAIAGMEGILDGCERFAGICEVEHLPVGDLRWLMKRFSVEVVFKRRLERQPASLDQLMGISYDWTSTPYCKDVILTPPQ